MFTLLYFTLLYELVLVAIPSVNSETLRAEDSGQAVVGSANDSGDYSLTAVRVGTINLL